MNEYTAKQILNYIYENNLSEIYEITPFININLLEEERKLCEKYIRSKDIDTLLESIINQYSSLKKNIYHKITKLPTSLNKMGHMLECDNINLNYFIGRNEELQKIYVVLNKKIKNNALIIGHPGTGKTSLLEAYAKKYGVKNIFVVECAKLISNTEFRGVFEQKIVELMKFAKTMNLILFFDELHVLMELGKSQGGISITDILKPYLLDNEMCFIGATTIKESDLLMSDEAFKRRLTTIYLPELADEQLLLIKEKFDQVIACNSVLNKEDTRDIIQELRSQLTTQYFPDKFIDFLDFMCSYKNVINNEINYKILLKEYISDQRMETFK